MDGEESGMGRRGMDGKERGGLRDGWGGEGGLRDGWGGEGWMGRREGD